MISPFDVTIEERNGAAYMTLVGELDISTAAPLEDNLQRIEADQPRLLVIDLSRLDFMDSTGLRVLLGADQRARADGRGCGLMRDNDIVQRVLALSGLDERREMVDEPGPLASA